MGQGIFLVNNEGVKSFQSADYNSYYALAEIIDNSIQAGAKNIHVIGIQENELINKRSIKKLKEIIIYDDGSGMDEETAKICLQLGGGRHIGAKTNLGKFGMGLPQASGSQCMRTEVYTWQNQNKIISTYLDYDELIKKNPPMLPNIKHLKNLPHNLKKIISHVINRDNFNKFSGKNGTIIYWKNAHKLDHKTYPAFYRNFEEFIGRVYRYFLINRKFTISLSGFEKIGKSYKFIEDKSLKKIRVNDPLFLMKNSILGRHDKKYKVKSTSEKYGESFDGIILKNKKYNVKINFSKVKPGFRKELKNNHGVEPGSSDIGKLYGKNMGVSLLRAKRELKLSDFGFVGDRSDPTQRWWGAEVQFQPDLDDLFRVTFDKQEAKAFRKISKDEYQEDLSDSGDESLSLMYEISKILSNNISEMRKKISKETIGTRGPRKHKAKCTECGALAVIDNKCQKCGYKLSYCQKHTDQRLDKNRNCPICSMDPVDQAICTKHNKALINGECEICKKERGTNEPIPPGEVTRLKSYLEDNFQNYKGNRYLLKEAINYFQKTGRDHFMVYTSADVNSFINYTSYGKITIISINTNHPFYKNFMHEILEDENRDLDELVPIHLLIGAIVNAEQQDYDNKEILEDFRGQFSVNLKKLMRNYKFPSI